MIKNIFQENLREGDFHEKGLSANHWSVTDMLLYLVS
jgi:hypothetical protein